MQTWIALAVGVVVGAALAAIVARARYAVHTAVVQAERDLLRERVVDLEAAVSEDAQTAAALAPLRQALERVEGRVDTMERDRTHQFAALEATMGHVRTEAASLSEQTRSLAGSLNASTVRGAWGEVQLRRVLEHAGLMPRCDFDEQVSAISHHDQRVRPDVVVRLPGGKVLVVDAKAPMDAFLKAQADGLADEDRRHLLQQHAASLKGHVRSLAAKDYWSAFETSPQMVVAFVPGDAMLAAALSADPGLHEAALADKVAVVGPSALMALLRTVAFTWQQEALTQSARELLSLGRELYARLGTLGGHVSRLGGTLQRSVETYNQLVGALESRVLVTARRMHDLDLVESDLPTPAPVDLPPRVLTAMELIEQVTAADARPELDLPSEVEAGFGRGDEEHRSA